MKREKRGVGKDEEVRRKQIRRDVRKGMKLEFLDVMENEDEGCNRSARKHGEKKYGDVAMRIREKGGRT